MKGTRFRKGKPTTNYSGPCGFNLWVRCILVLGDEKGRNLAPHSEPQSGRVIKVLV